MDKRGTQIRPGPSSETWQCHVSAATFVEAAGLLGNKILRLTLRISLRLAPQGRLSGLPLGLPPRSRPQNGSRSFGFRSGFPFGLHLRAGSAGSRSACRLAHARKTAQDPSAFAQDFACRLPLGLSLAHAAKTAQIVKDLYGTTAPARPGAMARVSRQPKILRLSLRISLRLAPQGRLSGLPLGLPPRSRPQNGSRSFGFRSGFPFGLHLRAGSAGSRSACRLAHARKTARDPSAFASGFPFGLHLRAGSAGSRSPALRDRSRRQTGSRKRAKSNL